MLTKLLFGFKLLLLPNTLSNYLSPTIGTLIKEDENDGVMLNILLIDILI